MAKNKKNRDRKQIREMTDTVLVYTLNQYRHDLNEYGGTTDEWNFYKMMREECCQRFINQILYDFE